MISFPRFSYRARVVRLCSSPKQFRSILIIFHPAVVKCIEFPPRSSTSTLITILKICLVPPDRDICRRSLSGEFVQMLSSRRMLLAFVPININYVYKFAVYFYSLNCVLYRNLKRLCDIWLLNHPYPKTHSRRVLLILSLSARWIRTCQAVSQRKVQHLDMWNFLYMARMWSNALLSTCQRNISECKNYPSQNPSN